MSDMVFGGIKQSIRCLAPRIPLSTVLTIAGITDKDEANAEGDTSKAATSKTAEMAAASTTDEKAATSTTAEMATTSTTDERASASQENTSNSSNQKQEECNRTEGCVEGGMMQSIRCLAPRIPLSTLTITEITDEHEANAEGDTTKAATSKRAEMAATSTIYATASASQESGSSSSMKKKPEKEECSKTEGCDEERNCAPSVKDASFSFTANFDTSRMKKSNCNSKPFWTADWPRLPVFEELANRVPQVPRSPFTETDISDDETTNDEDATTNAATSTTHETAGTSTTYETASASQENGSSSSKKKKPEEEERSKTERCDEITDDDLDFDEVAAELYRIID